MATEGNKVLVLLVLSGIWLGSLAFVFEFVPHWAIGYVTWSKVFSFGSVTFLDWFWTAVAKLVFIALSIGIPYISYRVIKE